MRAVVFALCMLILGCDVQENETDLVWAVNVGGPAYEGVDGTKYVAEGSIVGGIVARMPVVKGSQDPALYETYREGDIEIAHPIANGTYDITFHFAEPEQFGAGERVFSAHAEGVQIVDSIDVMLWRDGKVRSALTVTVPGIVVGDGMLDIRFEARKREPILSALVVRQRAGGDRKSVV